VAWGVDYKSNDVDEITKLARIHWDCGNNSAILVTVPIPKEFEIETKTVKTALKFAIRDADQAHGACSEITPYLLQKMNEYNWRKNPGIKFGIIENNPHRQFQPGMVSKPARHFPGNPGRDIHFWRFGCLDIGLTLCPYRLFYGEHGTDWDFTVDISQRIYPAAWAF